MLARAAAIGNWWVVVLWLVSPDGPKGGWLIPFSGIAHVCALHALISKQVHAVLTVGVVALLIGSAWAYVAMREPLGSGQVDPRESVWWGGLVAVHLTTFDAARRHTPSDARAPYEQAFDQALFG